MGDIKKAKKKYSTSAHPWIRKDLEEYKTLRKQFGLKNRREILKAISFLRKYKNIAKKLIAMHTTQADVERKQMITKLQGLGLISTGASLDEVLSLQTHNILERRLESLVHKKGLAKSVGQARQFIVHRHIMIAGKEITSPSFLVSAESEALITFKSKSPLASEAHPERIIEQPESKDTKTEKAEVPS